MNLRRLLQIDAAVTLVIGVVVLLDAGVIAERLGRATSSVQIVGEVLIALAVVTAAASTRFPRVRRQVPAGV